QDRALGNTELVGKLGWAPAPWSNWAHSIRPHRVLVEKLLGIDRTRNLPAFARPRFSRWFDDEPAAGPVSPTDRVALFATCQVEYHTPAPRRAAVRVLRRNGVDVSRPSQRCCGMPYLDGGGVEEARRQIDDNVRSLGAAVRDGRQIVVPGPTCSYMMKQEWPWLATDRETA